METCVWEDFAEYPNPATIDSRDTYDVHQYYSEGKYRTSYKVVDPESGSNPWNYQGQVAMRVEPLTTNKIFKTGGSHELSANDLAKIKQAEATGDWSGSDFSNPSTPLGLYASLALQGIDSYEMPTVLLNITIDEGTQPDLSLVGRIVNLTHAPVLPDGCTWKMEGATWEALSDSGDFRNTYTFKASGPNGWNTTIYGEAANWPA